MKCPRKHPIIPILFLSAFFMFSSCSKTMPGAPAPEETLEGPLEELSNEERARHLRGDLAFSDVFTTAEGLGPIFVSNQCASCHPADGKGAPFMNLIRFGQSDTGQNPLLNAGGPQLQHRAIPGYKAEVLPGNAPRTTLLAPAVSGLGFLDAVSDADLLALADPEDADGDGISGRAHWKIPPPYARLRPGSVESNGRYIHRFGKKASAYDLLHQSAMAYNQDMGIVSSYEAIDPFSGQAGPEEVANSTVGDVVFYVRTLRAPARRNAGDASVKAGKEIFAVIGCASCHVPELKTGPSDVAALSEKTFYPYTDLLLHDMGAELDDGYAEGNAMASEWRTPALWGLGLSKASQGGAYFLLHDGRAGSIEEAITWHGGEAFSSREEFRILSRSEKDQLIAFLESL